MASLSVSIRVTLLLVPNHAPRVDNSIFRSAARHAGGEQFGQKAAVFLYAHASTATGHHFIWDRLSFDFQTAVAP